MTEPKVTHGALTDHTFPLPPGWKGSATFSEDGVFRYVLARHWHDLMPGLPPLRRDDPELPPYLAMIGTNPSAAAALRDDTTVRLVALRAFRIGYYGLTVLNASAFRATKPKELKDRGWLIGPDNDATILAVVTSNQYDVLACWGEIPPARDAELRALLRERMKKPYMRPPMCLGLTKAGRPLHPLHQPRDRRLEPLPL